MLVDRERERERESEREGGRERESMYVWVRELMPLLFVMSSLPLL